MDEDCSVIKFECRSTKNVKKGEYDNHRKYSEDEIDYFYTCWNNVGYLIPVSECNTLKTLRLKPPKKNTGLDPNFAKNYEIENVVAKILQEY
jgi:hypothetical protein